MDWRHWISGLATFCAAYASMPAMAQDTEQIVRTLQRAPPDQAAETEVTARRMLADGSLTPALARKVTYVLANAIADQDRCPEETPAAERAMRAPEASVFAWRFAIALTYHCNDYDRASALLSELYRRYPEEIADLNSAMMFRTAIRSRDTELLSFIARGGWATDDPAIDISPVRLALIRAHLAAGDNAAATEAARALADNGTSNLGSLIVLLSDRTLDSVVASDPARFDFVRMVNRFADNNFANYAAHPDRLSVLNALASTLKALNRSDEALLLVDDALARIGAAEAGEPPFTDIEDALNWTYQVRAQLRRDLGRDADALDDLAAGAEHSEGGSVNVSQRLNRAGYLLAIDRPADALAEAQAVRPADLSPYGRSVRRSIMVCANAELGHTQAMREALAETEAHAADSYSNLQSAAICADDLDLAAHAFMSRLESPAERDTVIQFLQGFAGETPAKQWQNAHPFYGRADVRAAIDRQLRVRTYPISRPYN